MHKNSFYLFYFNRLQLLRIISLCSFSFLAVWAGYEFRLFLSSLETGKFFPRPPGADSFLPISSLMNIRYFLSYGEVHRAHPAGFFFLAGALFVSWFAAKSFCGWVCPFGFLSEILLNLRKLILKRDFEIPRPLDYFLRSFKYLILFFFVYVIFVSMDLISLVSFLDSPYNKISDIKMYYFFAKISFFAAAVIVSLIILSFFFNFFWCRYLCPYGALMALAGFFSPFRIKREKQTCSSCQACRASCPHRIDPMKNAFVFSDDCSSCLMCVSACSSRKSLLLGNCVSSLKISPFIVPFFIAAVFALLKIYAVKSNLWQNNIGQEEYKVLMGNMSKLQHPGI